MLQHARPPLELGEPHQFHEMVFDTALAGTDRLACHVIWRQRHVHPQRLIATRLQLGLLLFQLVQRQLGERLRDLTRQSPFRIEQLDPGGEPLPRHQLELAQLPCRSHFPVIAGFEPQQHMPPSVNQQVHLVAIGRSVFQDQPRPVLSSLLQFGLILRVGVCR